MHAPLDPQAWVSRAEEDCTLARLALRRKIPLTYGATFHAQQCAEKYLKALLVAQGLRFPRTHDLAALSDLCLRNDIDIRMEQDSLERLAAYAVEVRYPGEYPSIDDAREALQIALAVRRSARKLLKRIL